VDKPKHSDKRQTVLVTVSLPSDLEADARLLAKAGGEALSAFVTRSLLASPRLVAYRMGKLYQGIVSGEEKDIDAAIRKMRETLDSTLPACEIAGKLDAELRRFQELRRDQAAADMAASGVRELVE